MKKNLSYKIALRAMLVALAFILSWVESQIPYPFPLPGMKIGLTNLVVLLALYRLSYIDALAINIVRILLVGFTFGNMFSLYYSLAGGLLSFLVMFVLKKYTKWGIKFISVAGAVNHNLGQILLAMFILKTVNIAWYIPFLWVSALVSGLIIGLLCQLTIKRLPTNLFLLSLIIALPLISGCGLANTNHSFSQLYAMDTYMTIDANGKGVTDTLKLAEEKIHELDNLWSVGLHNSEISRLNQGEVLELSWDTENVLKEAISISNETDGALDITVYPLMELWGFTTKSMKRPSDENIKDRLSTISMDKLSLDTINHKLDMEDGVLIDLGAIAKGYACDQVVSILKENNITSANINLGGNVYVIGKKTDGSKWKIGIENPDNTLDNLKSAQALGVLEVSDKAIVTSGDYNRFFVEDGVKYHHIMDPKTGYPANSGLISITVISDSATKADGLSTALFVMGKEKALSYWKEHSDSLDLILVEKTGEVTITSGIKNNFTSSVSYSVFE